MKNREAGDPGNIIKINGKIFRSKIVTLDKKTLIVWSACSFGIT